MRPDEPISLDDEATQRAERYRRQKSTAVLTILFTDIADSTRIRESLGEITYEKAREEHDLAISALIESANAGAVVKGTGDGHLAVFAEPSVAVERSLRIQALMRRHEHFRLRIGLDMGQVSKETMGGIVTDVFGRHVNRAARISTVAEPQHILTTYQVYDCSVGWLSASEIGWREQGRYDLKGFSDRVSLYEPFEKRQPTQSIGLSESFEKCQAMLNYDAASGTKESKKEIDLETSDFSVRAPHRPRRERVGLPREPSTIRESHISLSQESRTLEEELLKLSVALATRRVSARPMRGLSKFLSRLGRRVAPPNSILWVDDHPENNVDLVRLLEASGCVVERVRSTEEALARLKTCPYRVVISDMGRGENSKAGLDLLEQMRSRRIGIPTAMYTSVNAAAIYGEEAKRLGAIECTPGAVTLLAALSAIFSR
jgi:class 3 adenylate cyclase/CheY-like chemotaxis protein